MTGYVKIFITTLFLAGILFRLFLAYLVPQPFVFDQGEYWQYAKGLLTQSGGDLSVASYRTYGYPLIISAVFRIFGTENRMSVMVFQAILDSITALLVFSIGRRVFQKAGTAWVGYILYLFNPITSAYVGVLLTEILTTFFITLIIFLFLKLKENPRLLIFEFCAFSLGYLPYVRPGFFFLSICLMCLLLFSAYKTYKKTTSGLFHVLLIGILFLIPIFYNVSRNMIAYNTVSVMTVDNNFVKDFYLSFIIENQDTGPFPPNWNLIYQEYFTGTNKKERDAVASKYVTLAKQEIEKNPWSFVIGRVRRLSGVWDKQFLFLYDDPYREKLHPYILWGNRALLGMAVAGLVLWWKKEKTRIKGFMAGLTLFVVGYTSLVHMFVMASGRFSVPAYPLVFLFAGYFFANTRLKRP